MEYQLNMSLKECQSDMRYMFIWLKSWQEKSQKEFTNMINSQSTIIEQSLGTLVEKVNELQTQLSAVKKERDNLLETVATMGSDIAKLQAKLPSPRALPDSEENPCQDAEEIDCLRNQDQDVEVGSKMNIDDNDLEEHIDDAVNYPETFSSIQGIAEEAKVTDKIEERKTVQLSNKDLPEKETNNHDDLKMHTESNHKRGNSKLKCKYCPYTSDQMNAYRTHIQSSHKRETRKLHCKYCPYASDSTSRMKDHMIVHKSDKRTKFTCGECGVAHSRKRDLMRHIREVHQKYEI